MRQVLPGVYHWTTFHEKIRHEVHSCYVSAVEPAVLIDPRVPREGLEAFRKRPRPEHVYLTNRHHYRHSARFQKAFGCQVWCHRAGLHEFREDQEVASFEHGDRLPGGVLALEVAVLCPEETALFIPAAGGIVALGDALVRHDGRLGFVPDEFMGDDPMAVKRGLAKAFRRLLRRKFDHLLLAHGRPVRGGAKAKLRAFVESVP